MKLLILTVLILLSGCEEKFSISREHAIYETTFAFIIRDATKNITLAKDTNVAWHHSQIIKPSSLTEFYDLDNKEIQVPKQLLNQFIQLNKSSSPLTWEPIMVSVNAWEGNEKQTPYHQVSKVAISETGQHALVNFTYHCVLCGGSWLVYLEFKNNMWFVKASRGLWVS